MWEDTDYWKRRKKKREAKQQRPITHPRRKAKARVRKVSPKMPALKVDKALEHQSSPSMHKSGKKQYFSMLARTLSRWDVSSYMSHAWFFTRLFGAQASSSCTHIAVVCRVSLHPAREQTGEYWKRSVPHKKGATSLTRASSATIFFWRMSLIAALLRCFQSGTPSCRKWSSYTAKTRSCAPPAKRSSPLKPTRKRKAQRNHRQTADKHVR